MTENIAKARYVGVLDLNGVLLDCAVLDGAIRLLSERSVTKGLGGKRGGSHWRRRKADPLGAHLPVYISANNLKAFIPNDLLKELGAPIKYQPVGAHVIANGLKAELLPSVCDVWVNARDAGVLKGHQVDMANQAEILKQGLSVVGIIALIDEATGFQKDRAQNALAEILEAFISKSLCQWVKTFPDEYYEQLFRLRGMTYDYFSTRRPVIIGKLTNDIIYKRLAPGVLKELNKQVPRDDKGRLKHHLHQKLTRDFGHPKLRELLAAVIALMKVAPTYRKFNAMLNRAFPRPNVPPELPGMDSIPYDVELEEE